MRKSLLYILLILGMYSVAAKVQTRFFIGEKEVSETFYNNIPDSIINKSILTTFDYDTLLVKTVTLPFTHYLDTISQPGEISIRAHPADKIKLLTDLLLNNSQNALKFYVGDKISESVTLLNIQNKTVDIKFSNSGKCYFISFWATWCGNCLIELQNDNILQWIEQFKDNPDFEFLPICIDSDPSELNQFFESKIGEKWKYLTNLTLLILTGNRTHYLQKAATYL